MWKKVVSWICGFFQVRRVYKLSTKVHIWTSSVVHSCAVIEISFFLPWSLLLPPFPTKLAEKSVLNLVSLCPIWIVVAFFRLIWHRTDFPFDVNLFGQVWFRDPHWVFLAGFRVDFSPKSSSESNAVKYRIRFQEKRAGWTGFCLFLEYNFCVCNTAFACEPKGVLFCSWSVQEL